MLPSEFETLTSDARRLGRLEVVERLMGELVISPGDLISEVEARSIVEQVRFWLTVIRDRLAALTGGWDADAGQALTDQLVHTIAYPEKPVPPLSTVPRIEASPRGAKLHAWCAEHGLVGQALVLAKSNFRRDLLEDLTDAQVNEIWKLLKPMRSLAKAPPPLPPPPSRPQPTAQVEKEGAVNENGHPIDPGWPRSGRMLYPWCKKMEELYQTAFVDPIDEAYVKGRGWPRSFKDWDGDMAEQAARFMIDAIRNSPHYNGHADQYVNRYDTDRDRLRSESIRLANELLVQAGHVPASITWEMVRDQVGQSAESIADQLYGADLTDPSMCDSNYALRRVVRVMEETLGQVASI